MRFVLCLVQPGNPAHEVGPSNSQTSSDIAALQLKRALLQRQLEEEARLAAWRRNAISQAASGGRRAVELEVRPIYLLPDTNCYIDWLEGIATLAQRSSNYTVLVPIVGRSSVPSFFAKFTPIIR